MSSPTLVDQVLDFYYDLFDGVFGNRFAPEISNRIKRDQMRDRVKTAARAASESLIRYLQRRRISGTMIGEILSGLRALTHQISSDAIGNPNIAPERQAEDLLNVAPCPSSVEKAGLGPDYGLALKGIARDLARVGPVMATWRKLGFPRRFEQLERAISEFEEITERMDAFGPGFDGDADENFELDYRDYILQRFYQVEAGTVRMSTQTFIDLRWLFVMPDLAECAKPEKIEQPSEDVPVEAMTLSAARVLYERRSGQGGSGKKSRRAPALKRVARANRVVIIGPPGSGKSTFLEWLNLQLAGAELEFPQGDQQAIPLLLRVRQLDPRDQWLGPLLIAVATEGRDRAERMPEGWMERQMTAGRVVLMLDGLDETDPEIRDRYLLPSLERFCLEYPNCRFVVSSRPVGYPPRRLAKLGFTEVEVCDFTPEQMKEYATNWCTAIRLARNEPKHEAKTEGEKEGEQILASFQAHAHIADLARTPLMLSAICLVNYFEGGNLPQDRALLYRLCVEGLLHHWDQRRGITSEFSLSDKLRVCREVAIAMQADDLAEMSEGRVTEIFEHVLGSSQVGDRLLQHIRYRTGILIERRPRMFAFAHLTFQEYLTACAILEGNHRSVDAGRIVQQHLDGKWKEVIALYCGIAPAPLVRSIIDDLLACKGSDQLSSLLADAYFAAGKSVILDSELRMRIMDKISKCPAHYRPVLESFDISEVSIVANRNLGLGDRTNALSESFRWLQRHGDCCDGDLLMKRMVQYNTCNVPGEIIFMIHYVGKDEEFKLLNEYQNIYGQPAAETKSGPLAICHGEIALIAITMRPDLECYMVPSINKIGLALASRQRLGRGTLWAVAKFIHKFDRELKDYIYQLSEEVENMLCNLRVEPKVYLKPLNLDRKAFKMLCQAFAARIEGAHRSGHDPGWPDDLPGPLRKFLEQPND
jgi:energy-coupling factor transporter ATP-binding protein EcfA2